MTVVNEAGRSIEYRYDPLGNLIRVYDNSANVLLESRTYDSGGRLIEVVENSQNSTPKNTHYYYDADNRIIEMGTTKNGAPTSQTNYAYSFSDGQSVETAVVLGDSRAGR